MGNGMVHWFPQKMKFIDSDIFGKSYTSLLWRLMIFFRNLWCVFYFLSKKKIKRKKTKDHFIFELPHWDSSKMIKRQNICIVCKINYYIITCNFTVRSFDLFVFRSFELGNPTQKTLVKNDKKLSFLTKSSLSFDRKTAIFSVWKPF